MFLFVLVQAFMEQMPKVTAPRVRSVGLNSHVVLTCNPPDGLPKAEVFWTKGIVLQIVRVYVTYYDISYYKFFSDNCDKQRIINLSKLKH